MTTRVQSSPPAIPCSLPPRPRAPLAEQPTAIFVQPTRDPSMHRQLKPPALVTQRRASPVRREQVRGQALPMAPPVHAIIDELSDLLALDERANPLARMRPNEFARPSWCTHEGVTVTRIGHRTCLRCGAILD